jgi:hypothetical protein
MPDEAGRDAAFYDHENESRRHVADWGGDELFTRMPRRGEAHPSPAPRFRRTAPLDPAHRPVPADGAGRTRFGDAGATGEGTGRFRRDDRPGPHVGDWTGDLSGRVPSEGDRPRPAREPGSATQESAPRTPARAVAARSVPAAAAPSGTRANAPGRRTVVIAGRPDAGARPLPQRLRGPKTVAERVGPRPERIVAWAFALGLLLILIAVATADAATL